MNAAKARDPVEELVLALVKAFYSNLKKQTWGLAAAPTSSRVLVAFCTI